MFDPTRPFVLLDDVAAGRARLFSGLIEAVVAETADAVLPALTRLVAPRPWAGFVGFEAGYALEAVLPERSAPAGEPLLWFGHFAHDVVVDAKALLGGGPASLGDAVPGIDHPAYAARLARVAALIAAGDIYQANLTFNALVAVGGHPLHLYARLRAGSRAPYGALLFTGSLWVLSFSPELFFRLDGRQLTARPMKGTARRGGDAAEDAALAAALQADPKNRAENLMIVDLLRNDLSRVGDNVAVPALFDIETYPTVLQMTSTITATARAGMTAADVLARLFPCGSVTGAPKIRAMQVIAEVEDAPRGVYTGSIGAISASGDAVFNVAIRTLVMAPGWPAARLGLGSGIVADSAAPDEWAECLAKARFLHRRGTPDLIETMRVEAGTICDLGRHLARMTASAAFLGIAFNPDAARALLVRVCAGATGRARLLAAPSGALAVQLGPLPQTPAGAVRVAVVPLPVDTDDWRLRHKTGDRDFYDAARRTSGEFEAVFVRPDGYVTEGSFTNVFMRRGGVLVTPPVGEGLLPGILRARLLAAGEAVEGRLTAADLDGGFFIGNALRGLLPAQRV
ncbi:aminodeoxychorismate synthase component I [Polymorphobacter fuscus]|uniref:Probable branched-chain-amino-acid aminotransferase n=1 Tax=Sandarakinorhabdus fusca TaxID=1439888 RepID=A0A7C9KXS4_9SPHN|nr:aminodeoxychorismate synthase component I [Polymorphobacter fuscus]KAB7648531.1 aminodeoxychorismate synthase component I [Polymorphobacter fuscus]MQT16068.1 aminodeoxychorismate synthase component I [Polymorphobacter fuscus]NJC07654.1 para-aminobenzoate synthetase/4-amino-4-deoxychorismate lyase [Polymorphobacter fuscus]